MAGATPHLALMLIAASSGPWKEVGNVRLKCACRHSCDRRGHSHPGYIQPRRRVWERLSGAAPASGQLFSILLRACASSLLALQLPWSLTLRLVYLKDCKAPASPCIAGACEEGSAHTTTALPLTPPKRATQVQALLGASRAVAFDLTAACSGFVLALVTGAQYIRTGTARNVLVIGADALSRYVDWRDRCAPSGAGQAVALEACKGCSCPGCPSSKSTSASRASWCLHQGQTE